MYRKHNIIAQASNQHRAHLEIFKMKYQMLQTNNATAYFYEEEKKSCI